MNINELIALQESFDRRHGWTVKTNNVSELIDMLHRDVVGLVGEVGEFANILKKLALILQSSRAHDTSHLFETSKIQLSEELIDVLIYLMRIAAYLHMDIEQEYRAKLKFNEERYKEFEI
jgi:NTP pyrophosphatase (non-canonical NTP hydrolase)